MKKAALTFIFAVAFLIQLRAQTDTLISPCLLTFSRNGYMFDLEAGPQAVTINYFYSLTQNPGTRDVRLYFRPGPYSGFENDENAWTLVGEVQAWTPANAIACPIPPAQYPLKITVCIPAGERYGFYYVMSAGTGTFEARDDLVTGSLVAQDNNLTLYTGLGTFAITTAPFNVSYTQNMSFEGMIEYGFPKVSLGSDTIICAGTSYILDAGTGFENYLWSTGDTSQTISVTTSGTYIVQVQMLGGCLVSDTVEVVVTPCSGLEEIQTAQQVYSSFQDGTLFLHLNGQADEKIVVEVTDAAGRIFYNMTHAVSSGPNTIPLDLNGLAEGLYLIRVGFGNNQSFIVKQVIHR